MELSQARVFIPNKGYHDYTDAKRYGELSFVTTGIQNKFGVANMARLWEDALADSLPTDYILQTSLSILTSIGIASFAMKHEGRVNVLLWQRGKYIERTIILNKGENYEKIR